MSGVSALDGLLVLDLTTFLSGPYCTMMLGDLGADVIKVERPEGDEARRMPPFMEERSQPFALWNRNKCSIALDLKAAADASCCGFWCAGPMFWWRISDRGPWRAPASGGRH
ncbi:MAG: L-carnitine dehydratase/bile acid-inducible protein [Rubritepida sp.]|nr:L-carnitine dehydratase/bile acid-inducible protein [Rubritepida sp.]